MSRDSTRFFLTSVSTYWVTLIRLGLIVLPCLVSSASVQWIYNHSLLSVLIRPDESLPHLEEAHAIWTLAPNSLQKNISSYYLANDSIRIPPLVLAVFMPLLRRSSNLRLWFSILLLLIDLIISHLIEQIGLKLLGFSTSSLSLNDDKTSSKPKRLSREEDLQQKLPESGKPRFAHIFGGCAKSEGSPSIPLRSLPLLSAQIYYWSPFTALPASLFCCWQNIPSLFLLASIYESICYSSTGGSLSMASFYLAVASYLEPHHIAYIVPIILLSASNSVNGSHSSETAGHSKKDPKTTAPTVFVIVFFTLWSLALQGIACHLVGKEGYRKVLGTTYGNTWLATSPNLSLQWYFRMQIFSRFRNYFGAIHAGIPFVLVAPLCLRFFRYPGLLLAFFTMIWTIYRPVQVLYDANFAFCFFLLCPKSLMRMGYASVIALCCLFVPVILNIVDDWMWLDANNGNANYIFFQCIAYNVFLGIILGQFTSASMHRDKALRLAQKENQDWVE